MFFCHDYCPSLSVDKMPMPSLKMKTNQTTDCLKEKNGIHVCPMSTKISKTSLSRLKIVQNAEDVASIVQTTQSVSCNKERSIETEDEFHNNETVDRDTLKCQKHHESLTKWTTLSCKMESMPALCPTNFDHIFSPIMESIDINSDAYLKYFDGDNILSVPQLEAEDSDDISKESLSREYYSCRISDFSISDIINFTSIPFLSELTYYDDNTDVRFFPDPKCEELITSFEMDSTEHKPFSYLNSDVENGYVQDNRVSENVTVSCDSSLYFSIHQSRSSNSESERNCSYGDADQADCFDPHTFIRNLPDLPNLASDLSSSIPSNDRNTTKRVTLVLDLDETLVHSTWEQCDDVDFTFIVFFNTTVYVKKRPHLHAFLNRVAEMFDIVIFTASQSIYAKPILDKLDPDGKIISNRAYRESCIFSNGSYTKDLTVLGVDLAKVFIIDNSPQVFRLQVNNGIPIKSWFDDPSDSALLSLLPFLETLVDVDDVRPVIAKRFGNHKV